MDKTEDLHKKVKELRNELHAHAEVVDDDKCAALCETSSEVLGGVEKSFDHFLNKNEAAWQ